MWMVHAYPCIPNMEAAIEALAANRKEPSQQEMLAAAHDEPMAAEYAGLADYAGSVTRAVNHAYVPVPRLHRPQTDSRMASSVAAMGVGTMHARAGVFVNIHEMLDQI